MPRKPLTVIGRAERIQLIDYSDQLVPAKVDTGADISSIWASAISEQGEKLQFVLFAKGSPFYTGQTIELGQGDYRLTRVANSFGGREMRYVVKLRICVLGRIIKASFTLADRSSKIYPVLIGRKLLKHKFIVDVTRGEPLVAEEKAKLKELHVAIAMNED